MNLDRATKFWLVAVAFSITGFGLALISAAMLAKGYQASGWSTTTARIVRSDVEVSRKTAGVWRTGRTISGDFHSARIEYEYTIDGKKYVGDQITIGDTYEGFDRSVADAAVAKYAVGSVVTIYYDPDHPNRALVDRQFGFGVWWLAFGCAMLEGLVGVALWVKAARISAADRAASGVAATSPRRAKAAQIVKPSRPTHWAVRFLCTVLGLASLFVGALVLVSSIAKGPTPGTNSTAWIVMLAIMAGLAAFGGILVRKGMSRGPGAAA